MIAHVGDLIIGFWILENTYFLIFQTHDIMRDTPYLIHAGTMSHIYLLHSL
jgi:hypothetical protein